MAYIYKGITLKYTGALEQLFLPRKSMDAPQQFIRQQY